MANITQEQKDILKKLGYEVNTVEQARKALAEAFGYRHIPQVDIDNAIAVAAQLGFVDGLNGTGYRTGLLNQAYNELFSYHTGLSQAYESNYWLGFKIHRLIKFWLVKTA